MIAVISQQLLNEANSGNDSAIEAVCGYSIEFLDDFVRSHIRSIADADDIVQEILVILTSKLDDGLITSLDAFITQTARQFIKRHRSGEYSAGKRRQLLHPSYSQREIPFTQAFGGEITLEDLENMFDEDKFI